MQRFRREKAAYEAHYNVRATKVRRDHDGAVEYRYPNGVTLFFRDNDCILWYDVSSNFHRVGRPAVIEFEFDRAGRMREIHEYYVHGRFQRVEYFYPDRQVAVPGVDGASDDWATRGYTGMRRWWCCSA